MAIVVAALSGAALFATVATAQAPAASLAAATDRLLVLNKAGASLTMFDPALRKPCAEVEVGTGPHELAVSPDGRTAVVCNYGDQRPGSTLTVVDVPGARAVATLELRAEDRTLEAPKERAFLRPHGIRFVDDRTVAVTSEQTQRLLLVDVRDRAVRRVLPTAQRTLHMVALSRDRRTAFGASIADGTLGIFDLAADPVQPAVVVPTGKGAEGLAVSPTTGEVWVGNRAADTLSVVDPATRTVVNELATESFPIRVEFTPDGKRVLVSCAEAGKVQVFDAAARELRHTVDLQGQQSELSPLPIGICVDPDGRFAYVACGRGEFLAVIDLDRMALVDRIPAGPGPDGMAWARWRTAAGEAR